MRALVLLVLLAGPVAAEEDAGRSRELVGQLGGRTALLQLFESPRADGSARLSGEYWILMPLLQRFLEGERSKQLGVTFLKEGSSPILYGRPGTATLQGTWSDGTLRGTRYAPGGQERERFEFSEKFPSMQGYGAQVRCELAEGRYRSSLEYEVADGRLKRLDWRSRVEPSGHTCSIANPAQQPFEGGLRFAQGDCSVTMREVGDYVRLSAERCTAQCGSQAYLEPVLVEKSGSCLLLRPQER